MAAPTNIEVSAVGDLYALKRAVDCDEVVLRTHILKYRGALRHGLKFALWAVKPGGRIVVVDSGPREYRIQPYSIPFSLVLQQAFKVLGPETELEMLDHRHLTAIWRRTSPILPQGWSAAVLFSGRASEAVQVKRALDGLRRQPELSAANGGQIIVSGPSQSRSALELGGDVEYLAFENVGARAMVTQKKNAIVASARNPRVVVMHSRIVLQDGCLAALPREFDAVTPRVEYREGEQSFRHIDFSVEGVLDAEAVPTRLAPLNSYDQQRYLSILSRGRPYIDGGLFAARRSLFETVPLNPYLAWGEAEDLEWSARLLAAGYLVDLEPKAVAVSQTFKLPRAMVDRPRLFKLARRPSRLVRTARYRFTHLLESILRLR
jgi:hypothetical protein